MAVPNIFGTATAAIPLSQLDTNFATAITLGNTSVYLGNTTTSLGNVTLTNVTISSGNVTVTGANVSGTANIATLITTNDATISSLTVGRGAGAVATNTAVGASALAANQAGGTNNTAIGNAALDANTTGDANTAVGDDALGANTEASNNTAVGYQAGYTNQTGAFSTFFGYQSGYVSTATANCFYGANSGLSTTSGANNSFFGAGAGYYVSTGAKNTILGAYSGNQGGLDIRTASNYIVLSDGDGNPLISTNSTRSVALNGAVPQTGTGITFPATQSASTDANTLDDYEEGTFTPVPSSITIVSGTPVYTGTYTKIGNTVRAYFFMSGGNITVVGGSSSLTLPFTAPTVADTGGYSNNTTGAFVGGLLGYGTVMILTTSVTSTSISGSLVYRVA